MNEKDFFDLEIAMEGYEPKVELPKNFILDNTLQQAFFNSSKEQTEKQLHKIQYTKNFNNNKK